MTDLREIGASNEMSNFGQVVRTSQTTNPKNGKIVNRKMPMYNLTRDGFSLLAMGFTGKTALQWKIAFIDAFNTMERTLLAQSPTIDSHQVFNLSYKTHCRDIVLQRVKEMENQGNKQCISINSYSVVETMKDDKIHTKIEVTAEFAPYPKGD